MNERLTTTQFSTPVDTLTRQETERSTPSTDSSVYSDEAAAWLDEFFDRTDSDTTFVCRHTDRPAQAPYREVSAPTIFGPQSTLVRADSDNLTERPLTDNALFQGFVLLLAVTYVLLLYHNMLDIRTLLSRVFHGSSAGSDERRFEDMGSSRYARFMRTTSTIGILFIGILVVKYSRSFIDAFPLEQLSFAAEFVASLAVSVVVLLVIEFQGTLLRLVGALTLTQPLLTQLRQLRKLYFSTAVVLVSPALLLLTLSPAYTSALWFSLIAVASTVTLFLYLRETLTLFLAKKVSIVHWILYLCSIELFPVSLLWQLAVR